MGEANLDFSLLTVTLSLLLLLLHTDRIRQRIGKTRTIGGGGSDGGWGFDELVGKIVGVGDFDFGCFFWFSGTDRVIGMSVATAKL